MTDRQLALCLTSTLALPTRPFYTDILFTFKPTPSWASPALLLMASCDPGMGHTAWACLFVPDNLATAPRYTGEN